MANFKINGKKFDAAFCTVDTFRHLLNERQAENHLVQVANSLKKNGIYILGLHLLNDSKVNNKVIRWTNRRGGLTVKTSMTMLELDRKKRREILKVVLSPSTSVKKENHTSIYPLRTYTLKQLNRLLEKSGVFKIIEVFDEYYDIEKPVVLGSSSDYAVFILKKI